MPKSSHAKAKPVVISKPVKTLKVRLTKHMRDTLHRFMVKEFRNRLDNTEIDKTLKALVERTNGILRAKYPEEDMPVLRKYEMVHVDRCLSFTLTETGRVFGVRFDQLDVLPTEAQLADIPCKGGCYSREVFSCNAEFAALADTWERQIADRRSAVAAKEREYDGFLVACRYLQDVEAVIPLTEEVRDALGAQSRSLTVINPDMISRIRSDFAQEVAA